jgi:hypothetical protein
MWDLIKNDRVLKTIVVIVIGMFAFSFAFNIMFGTGSSSMEHGISSGGINSANSLGQIIVLLSKLLIIILLIAVIIAGIKFLQKHVIGNEPIKGIENIKNKPLKAVLTGPGGILVLLLVVYMISPSGNTAQMGHQAGTYSPMGYRLGIGSLLAPVLRLITTVSFIGLITGVVMYFKEQYLSNAKAGNAVSKELCSRCGTELKLQWKCCPGCGTDKNKGKDSIENTKDNGDK